MSAESKIKLVPDISVNLPVIYFLARFPVLKVGNAIGEVDASLVETSVISDPVWFIGSGEIIAETPLQSVAV